MAMTLTEKILAQHAALPSVRPGDIVEVEVDSAVLTDMNFLGTLHPSILRVEHPDKVIVVFDHLALSNNIQSATAHSVGRAFVETHGIDRFHDIGRDQGIVHEIIGEYGYAQPGHLIVCGDSHTCSGGAYNAAAIGLGALDLLQAVCTGRTWFECGETVLYRLTDRLSAGVATKDVFLHIAGTYGAHNMKNVEFCGDSIADLTVTSRRALATMCAELGADFAVFPFDEALRQHFLDRGITEMAPVEADLDAQYCDVRVIDLSAIEPMVALPDMVIDNCAPISTLHAENVSIDQCFIGSCANGTLDDIRDAAAILSGRHVHPGTRLIVTPASQRIFRDAVAAGYVEVLVEAGAVVTSSGCGACAGLSMGVLAPGEKAITSSTRNFRGRMGSSDASIYMASSASVAATACAGHIIDHRELS
jgi:3-isopropylmalate/(R)-2-methylmalate dehydratase large subunit